MAKFSFASQPGLRLLSEDQIQDLHAKALKVLETAGVKFESEEALKILADKGALVDAASKTARIKPEMVMDAIKRAPERVELFDREGRRTAVLGGSNVHFDPGSSAIKFMESDGITVRKSEARDLVQISRVNDALGNIALQSTAVTLYDVPTSGKVLIGTVEGDLHDIGKNLVVIMLESSGYQVVNLGVDISPREFAEAVREHKPDILGLSALLTTTMLAMKDTIDELSEAGVRDGLKVIIGGAPVTPDFADEIGADGYAPDGPAAVDLADRLLA